MRYTPAAIRQFLDEHPASGLTVANKIRPLALGRKNYMFAGFSKGAKRVAMMYSFFVTCKEHDVNPREWIRDVLVRVGNHPVYRVAELLPGAWKKSRKVGV